MNCVFNACGVSAIYFEDFTRYWIVIAMVGLVLPAHYIQEIITFLTTRKTVN